MTDGIQVSGLVKRYPRNRDLLRFLRSPMRREFTEVLQGIDLSIPRGGIYSLLGPNGAGKTTLLKSLAGLLLPNAGQITVDGVELGGDPAGLRERVSLAVCDERSFYWRISARENLRFFASLNGHRGKDRGERVLECLDLVGLADFADRRYMELSSGMRQKLALARGLLLDPSILMMDEPTRSLDPEATLRIHEVVRKILAQDPKRIVLYSTHDLAEAESISSHVIILRNGRIVTQKSLAKSGSSSDLIYCIRTYPVAPEALLEALSGVEVMGSHEDAVTVRIDDLTRLDALLEQLRRSGLRPLELVQKHSSLRDLYLASGEQGE
jgi:ABC-2 type transport system ATP-binding protein